MPTSLRFISIVVAAFALAACSGEKTPSTQATAETVLTPSPTPAPATSAPKVTTAPPVSTPSYPLAHKGYAEAVIAAWKAKNQTRLKDLTTAQVHEQLIEIPGPLNMEWAFLMCDGVAGANYCSFKNTPGDVVTLKISSQLLGKAHAAVEVKFDAKA